MNTARFILGMLAGFWLGVLTDLCAWEVLAETFMIMTGVMIPVSMFIGLEFEKE